MAACSCEWTKYVNSKTTSLKAPEEEQQNLLNLCWAPMETSPFIIVQEVAQRQSQSLERGSDQWQSQGADPQMGTVWASVQ